MSWYTVDNKSIRMGVILQNWDDTWPEKSHRFVGFFYSGHNFLIQTQIEL